MRFRLSVEVQEDGRTSTYSTTGESLGVLFAFAVQALQSDMTPTESQDVLREAVETLEDYDHPAAVHVEIITPAKR